MNQENDSDKQAASDVPPYLWLIGILFLLSGVLTFLSSLFGFSFSHSSEFERRHASKYQLKALGTALYNYYDTYDHFPPGMLVPQEGGPAYGWPVYLLPEIDEKARYGSLDFSQPYWSPDNQPFLHVDLDRYQNPMFGDEDIPTAAMHYALNSRVFQPNRYLKHKDIADGLSNTFAGGEIAEGIRLWYQPDHTRDPALGLNLGPQTFGTPYYGMKYGERVQMLMMDGSVRAIPNETDPDVLKALATPAAGDDPEDF